MLLAITSASAGCSWGLTRHPGPPPVRHVAGPPGTAATPLPAQVLPSCTTSNAAPLGDTVMATLFGLPAAFLLPIGVGVKLSEAGAGGDASDQEMGTVFVGLGLLYAVLATPWILSARTGYRNTRACREAWGRLGSPG